MWCCVRVLALAPLLALSLLGSTRADPPQQASQPVVLFRDVRIFDGKSAALSAPSNVLVRGNQIEKISTGPVPIDGTPDATTIDGGGRTLMPASQSRPVFGQRCRLPQSPGGSRGYRHIDARFHHDPRHGRPVLRT